MPSVAGGAPVVYAACTTIAILAVMSYGADLILSYLGKVSLGHTILWAAGGYAAAMLSVVAGWNGWQTAGASIVVSMALAVVLGLVTPRTREFVFSLVTYAAAVVAMEGAFNWPFLGGSDSIFGIPPLQLTLFGVGVTGGGNEELWPVAWVLLLLGPLIGTALIIAQQTFFSIGGDGDKIILGAVLAGILLLWPSGMIGVWEVLGARKRPT